MSSWDGTELFYRAWWPEGKKAKKALLLFHRGHEHSGRWQETVDSLGLDDVAIFAWDARGHGRSAGERGAARDLADMVKDVAAFVRQIAQRHGIALENMIVLAHSLAAVTVTAWVHDYAPPIRALILATAAFEVKLYVPLAIPALRLKQKLFGAGKVKSYVRAKMLTHDPVEAARYEADPLIFSQIAINVLLDLHDTAQRLLADAGAIQVPTLMLAAGRDWVVSLEAQRTFFDRLSSPVKRMHVFPAQFHAIFHEKERGQVIERTRAFIMECFAQLPPVVSLRAADQYGYTWEEYERLKLRGGPQFLAARAALRIGGRLSKGIESRLAKRFRFRPVSRLCLRESPARFVAPRQVHRRELSQQHRVAGSPSTQSQSRACASGRDRKTSDGGAPDPHSRHRCGRGPLCLGSDACAAGHLD